ncbi:MAG: hypothetical protein WC648_02845 [Candidatus Paceibacterota bacterium]|jgi:hypothetical protein
MKWKHPPIIKIYEALGSVADGRVEVDGNTAKIYSSSRNKYYDVLYDPNNGSIMTNDNGSYWKGYLGYPAIAFLMKIGSLSYDPDLAELLKGIAWKDINQKFKNDFDKTLEYILSDKTDDNRKRLEDYARKVDKEISDLNLNMLGKKVLPPDGY